jgi:Ca-activated chloride channel homolog
MHKYFLLVLLSFVLSMFCPVIGQLPDEKLPQTRILFIFDASQSMSGYWESDKKINIARNILINIVDSLEQLNNIQMGLRIYGHQSPVPPQDCSDTKLEVPFSRGNAPRIRQELRFVNPKGTTPIAHSLELGGKDFPDCEDCRNIIILITDGIEACDGDPCKISHALQKQGVTLKPFVIGIGIDEGFKATFDCIGNYYNADNEEKFRQVMDIVISQALNSTTAQVNLLDIHGNPTETDVNMTFYDKFSGHIKYNYIHTINHMGKPDTINLDHLITYRLQVHTIPPVFVDSVKLTVGKHTIIGANAPQGYLVIKEKGGGNNYRHVNCIVRESNKMESLNYQAINRTEKYLIGNYDIEIPVLPKLLINNVNIKQSHTTTIEIPRPGIVTLVKNTTGYGSLYHLDGKKQIWIYNTDPVLKNESIVLQPGQYRIVYRSKNAKLTLYTIVKTFEIKSGSSIALNLY